MIQKRMTLGDVRSLDDFAKHLYTDDEIRQYDPIDNINSHPLSKRSVNERSKYAYSIIMKNTDASSKYILPGQLSIFGYQEPKFKEELAYYDATPFVLMFGIFRTNNGDIREIGLNLHYYPPFCRIQILETVYNKFKPYFNKFFNDKPNKPNSIMSYNALKHIIRKDKNIAFGVKEYIPVLRGKTFVIPTRFLATAALTEGHFSKATLHQIYHFWRKYRF